MTAHTPGPWYWSKEGSLIQTSHITRDVWFIPMNEADQALIAAAPELLDALRELLTALDFEAAHVSRTEGERVAMWNARAAIAKAEGRAP